MRAAGNRLFLGVGTLKFKALLAMAGGREVALFGLAVGGKLAEGRGGKGGGGGK